MTEIILKVDGLDPLSFFGVNNTRFKRIKTQHPDIEMISRGREIKINGSDPHKVESLAGFLRVVMGEIEKKGTLSEERFNEMLDRQENKQPVKVQEEVVILHGVHGNPIKPKTAGQREVIKAADHSDIIFAIGPAGTGKTYLAVALAVKALKDKRIRKIYLVRPAVEAGENLGFLPGDLKEKVGPYLRPLYDALEEMIQYEKLQSYLEKDVIEIVPMAYMRGRTLNGAFVILDESQNATIPQFKMFLTRMGKGSKVLVTGDPSQIDLPYNQPSGLIHAMDLLRDIPEISIIRLQKTDVMRHPVVRKVIQAYETDNRHKLNKKDKTELPEDD